MFFQRAGIHGNPNDRLNPRASANPVRLSRAHAAGALAAASLAVTLTGEPDPENPLDRFDARGEETELRLEASAVHYVLITPERVVFLLTCYGARSRKRR
jgi:hypothetical protein